jgi:hypothetical protein
MTKSTGLPTSSARHAPNGNPKPRSPDTNQHVRHGPTATATAPTGRGGAGQGRAGGSRSRYLGGVLLGLADGAHVVEEGAELRALDPCVAPEQVLVEVVVEDAPRRRLHERDAPLVVRG